MKIIFIKSKFKRKILWKTLKRYEIKKMIEIGFDHVSLATLYPYKDIHFLIRKFIENIAHFEGVNFLKFGFSNKKDRKVAFLCVFTYFSLVILFYPCLCLYFFMFV